MKINEIKSEADFNNFKNGKNGAVLFTEVLTYLLIHANTGHECSCDNYQLPTAEEIMNAPDTLTLSTKAERAANANRRQNKKA